jgi:hypothetical protein
MRMSYLRTWSPWKINEFFLLLRETNDAIWPCGVICQDCLPQMFPLSMKLWRELKRTYVFLLSSNVFCLVWANISNSSSSFVERVCWVTAEKHEKIVVCKKDEGKHVEVRTLVGNWRNVYYSLGSKMRNLKMILGLTVWVRVTIGIIKCSYSFLQAALQSAGPFLGLKMLCFHCSRQSQSKVRY